MCCQSNRGTQRKARDIVIHNIICSSELARMCGMSYISQLGSVKNTRLAARSLILQRILTARSSNKKMYQPAGKHFKGVLRRALRFRALMTQIYKRRKYYRPRPKFSIFNFNLFVPSHNHTIHDVKYTKDVDISKDILWLLFNHSLDLRNNTIQSFRRGG